MKCTKIIGLITDGGDTKFRKLHVDVRDAHQINKDLIDQREKHMGKYKNAVTVTAIPLNVPSQHGPEA